MSLPRRVEPEWLDELPQSDPRAMWSRRDLKRINGWMLQARIMTRLVVAALDGQTPRTLVELGAGDGTFTLALAKRLAQRWRNVKVTLVDRQDIVTEQTRRAFHDLGWQSQTVCADVFDYLQGARPGSADIVLANLFLHHFERDSLAKLLGGAACLADAFAACEPWRAGSGLIGSRLLWAIGCNGVTRHDALVSVRAGFRERELSELWPNGTDWRLQEGPALPFTHCFLARRADGIAP
jgi:SAM-dependent methyltransferase